VAAAGNAAIFFNHCRYEAMNVWSACFDQALNQFVAAKGGKST
jgi:hypothetical protein